MKLTKEDMIWESIKRIEEKMDKHLEKCRPGLSVKEWSIIGGMITIVCSTITGIIQTIFK